MTRPKIIGFCLAAFILPVFLFPVLHGKHEYYDCETGVFLLFAVAAALTWLPQSWRVPTLAALLLFQSWTFWHGYYDSLFANNGLIPLAQELERRTKPDDVIVVYGFEWDPTLAYYSHRRAIMEPTTLESLDDVLKRGGDLDASMESLSFRPSVGGRSNDLHNGHADTLRVGAIVRCPSPWDGEPRYEAMMQRAGLPYMDKCQVRIR